MEWTEDITKLVERGKKYKQGYLASFSQLLQSSQNWEMNVGTNLDSNQQLKTFCTESNAFQLRCGRTG
jgi:hypothetical protein